MLFTFGQVKGNARDGRSRHQRESGPSRHQSFRVCKGRNELVESMTRLNAFEWKNWKSEKSWKSAKSNQNIVMNEEFVKNFVMDAKIDPKVVMELSMLNNWWHPRNQILLEGFMDENEPWLLLGIPNRDRSILCDTVLGKTLSECRSTHEEIDVTRESLHVMMQCYMRQHFADRYWLHEQNLR